MRTRDKEKMAENEFTYLNFNLDNGSEISPQQAFRGKLFAIDYEDSQEWENEYVAQYTVSMTCDFKVGYRYIIQKELVEYVGFRQLPEEIEIQITDDENYLHYFGYHRLDIFKRLITQQTIEDLFTEKASGSGIDCNWSTDETKDGKKILASNSFHTMTEHGYYDGYADFTVIIPKHSPLDFKLQFNGSQAQYKNRKYMLRDYLESMFHQVLYDRFELK